MRKTDSVLYEHFVQRDTKMDGMLGQGQEKSTARGMPGMEVKQQK